MPRPRRRAPLAALLLGGVAAALAAAAPPARAATPLLPGAGAALPRLQADSITGTVADPRGRPIQGARVTVVGTTALVLTDARGRFRLTDLGAGARTVRVTAIGYQAQSRAVGAGSATLAFTLADLSVNLDEVVITGTAGAVERRAVGNAITKVDARGTLERMPVTDVSQLLNGRASNVVLTANSGMAGAGTKVNIRGRNSLALTGAPLVYVDGIRMDAAQASGPGAPAVQGANVVSRLNDINPADIESIEIIKGPAAATLYGTEASNGVIQIITKAGRAGEKARVTFTADQGTNEFANPAGRIPTNYARSPQGQILAFNAVDNERALGNAIWRTGQFQRYALGIDGGTGPVSYRVSGVLQDDEGIDRNNRQQLNSLRANLQFLPRPSLTARLDVGVVTGKTTFAPQEGAGAPIFSALNANPLTKDAPSRGFFAAPPEVLYGVYDVFQLLQRTTVSGQLQHQAGRHLTQRLNLGVDLVQENNQNIVRRMTPDQARFFSPAVAAGRKDVQLRDARTQTFDYSATYTATLRDGLSSQTSVGAQYFGRLTRLTNVTGQQFPAPGLSTILGTSVRTGGDDYIENTTIGTYAQQQLGWRNRLFVTGAVRVDNNSAFGTDFQAATYPKISGSWVASEESWWKGGVVNTFKARAAYGAAGQQPDAFAALRTLGPVTGPGDQPALTTQAVGNPDLKPERGTELELGFDAGLFQDRVAMEVTWFRQNRRDAIVLAPVAPSSGFIGTRFTNLGAIRNDGFELRTTVAVLTGERVGWDLTATVNSNENEITDLGGQPPIFVGTFPRAQQHRVGFPVAAFFGQRLASATLDASGQATNLQCETPGGPAPCATAPLTYLGRSTPKYEGAVTSTVRLGQRLRLYTLVDFRQGMRRFDTNLWARCTVFRLCRQNYYPQEFDARDVAYAQRGSALVLTSGFINDASFAKLREVSVGYDLPDPLARRLRASRASLLLAARNLYTWTRWSGLDPETEQPGGFGELTASEQANLPLPRQVRFSLNLTF
jgi:TonB-linked SusC/RagA family outer membrane protein